MKPSENTSMPTAPQRQHTGIKPSSGPAVYPDGAGGKSPLRMPEYGRLVQKMAVYALTIEPRPRRQAYAERIIRVMAHLNPKLKNEKDFQNKLWDHLAYITDYQLDVDYPYEIRQHDSTVHPAKIPYPGQQIRFRHYGHLLEEALQSVSLIPEGPLRTKLTRQVAARMKRHLAQWKGDGASEEKVLRDMEMYTDGKLTL